MNLSTTIKLLLTIIGIAVLTGCASVSSKELAAADFGPYPTEHENIIKNYAARTLKDPYSAVYQFGTPRKGVAQDGIALGGKKHFGWIVPVTINAKNDFGAYTGERSHYFFIAEGQVGDITGLKSAGMARFLDKTESK